MKFRALAMMALAFVSQDKYAQERLLESNSYKKALSGTVFQNVNVGNSPIYIPTKSQQIKSKRLRKLNKNR